MNTAATAFDTAARTDRLVCLVAAAGDVSELLDAVRDYLAAWPAQKVARVQKVDGDWAPFDENQRPMPLARPADLRTIANAVHGQCSALRSAGMSLAPELLELDLFFFFARTKLAELEAQTCR